MGVGGLGDVDDGSNEDNGDAVHGHQIRPSSLLNSTALATGRMCSLIPACPASPSFPGSSWIASSIS